MPKFQHLRNIGQLTQLICLCFLTNNHKNTKQNTRFMKLSIELSDRAAHVLQAIQDNSEEVFALEEYTAELLTDIIKICWIRGDGDQLKS